jgi:hypothetical protein
MTKFKNLHFQCLPNSVHCGFFENATKALAEAGEDVQDSVVPHDKELNRLYAIEYANLEWYRKSTITARIVAVNKRFNKAVVGLSVNVNLSRHSFHPDVVEAAQNIYIMLRSYGQLTVKPYAEKIASVGAVLGHLTGELAADVQKADVAEWIPEIASARTEMAALIAERDARSLEKPEMGFREVRREIEKVWRAIVNIVNGGASLYFFSKEFERFMDVLNPEIDRLNKEYHRKKRSIAHSQPERIPVQTYTGYPCTPPLNVLFVTPKDGTVRLELGKDYNVTYKDNINVGSAECTIHGKGAYTGRKTVTFTIERL